jgi:hypothetical protein
MIFIVLLFNGTEVNEAADLAIRNEIPLTEELLERLSPPKRMKHFTLAAYVHSDDDLFPSHE